MFSSKSDNRDSIISTKPSKPVPTWSKPCIIAVPKTDCALGGLEDRSDGGGRRSKGDGPCFGSFPK